jgi:hypothetical protein
MFTVDGGGQVAVSVDHGCWMISSINQEKRMPQYPQVNPIAFSFYESILDASDGEGDRLTTERLDSGVVLFSSQLDWNRTLLEKTSELLRDVTPQLLQKSQELTNLQRSMKQSRENRSAANPDQEQVNVEHLESFRSIYNDTVSLLKRTARQSVDIKKMVAHHPATANMAASIMTGSEEPGSLYNVDGNHEQQKKRRRRVHGGYYPVSYSRRPPIVARKSVPVEFTPVSLPPIPEDKTAEKTWKKDTEDA